LDGPIFIQLAKRLSIGFWRAKWTTSLRPRFIHCISSGLKHGRKISDDKLKAFLDLDPQLTDDHRHNVFIYKGQTKWDVIGRLCDQITEEIKEHPHASTLRAVCFEQRGRKLDARTWN